MTANFMPAKARVLDLIRGDQDKIRGDQDKELLTLVLHKGKPELSKIDVEKEAYERIYSNVYFSERVPVCYAAPQELTGKVVSLVKSDDNKVDLGRGFLENGYAHSREELWVFVDAAYKVIPLLEEEHAAEVAEEYGKKILWATSPLLFFDNKIAVRYGIENEQRLVIKSVALWNTSI